MIKRLFKYLMETPDANSRFIFLLHGLVGSFCLLLLTGAFLYDHTGKAQYPDMVWAVGLVTSTAAVGRYLTKKVGMTDGVPTDQIQNAVTK